MSANPEEAEKSAEKPTRGETKPTPPELQWIPRGAVPPLRGHVEEGGENTTDIDLVGWKQGR